MLKRKSSVRRLTTRKHNLDGTIPQMIKNRKYIIEKEQTNENYIGDYDSLENSKYKFNNVENHNFVNLGTYTFNTRDGYLIADNGLKKNSRKRSHKKSRKSPKNAIILSKSKKRDKKFDAIIGNKTVSFGSKGYSDFTLHRDYNRMKRYENRHRSRENWSKSGIKSAGFWSKWILWNKPGLIASIKDTEKRFGIKIKRSKKKS